MLTSRITLINLRRDAQRGQGVVEFALVLPVLVMLIAGIVDLANAYQTYVSLTNATREGAAYGANPDGSSSICTRVQQALPNTISLSCGNVMVTYPAVTGDSNCPGPIAKVGCPIRVAVSYTPSMWLGSVLGFSITLNPSIDMMVLKT